MITTVHKGEKGLRPWLQQHASEPVMLGLDVESTGLDIHSPDWKLRLVQFGTKVDALVVEVEGHEDALRHILNHPTLTFVTHSNYDIISLKKGLGVDLTGRVKDTLILAKLAHPEREAEHGLKHLSSTVLHEDRLQHAEALLHDRFKELLIQASTECGDEQAKQLKKIGRSPKALAGWGFSNIPIDDPLYVKYAGLDAIMVRRLYDALYERATPTTRNLYHTEQWLSDQVTLLQDRGLRLDEPAAYSLLDTLGAEYEAAKARLESTFGFPALSPKRVGWLLEHGAQLNNEYVTPKGEPSLCKEQVTELAEKYTTGLLGTVTSDMKNLSTIKNTVTNLKNFIKHSTQARVHPQVKTLQAITGRMSVVNPPMQTLKKQDKQLRSLFLADAGMTLVAVDFSQIEIRVAAALSGDKRLTASILSGSDIHSDTAESIFGPDYTPQQRQIAKITNFGSIYGGGVGALVRNTGISEDDARHVLKKWKETYPELVKYGKQLSLRSHLDNSYGRLLPIDPDRAYASLNYMIQSTARDLFVQQMMKVITELNLSDNLWMLVHDELIFQVPTPEAEEWAERIKNVMETEFKGIPITADAEILGSSWGGEKAVA